MILNTHASYPHSRTYVLKLHRDCDPTTGRIAGRLEHIDSSHVAHFASAEELVACLLRDLEPSSALSQENGA